MLLYAMGYRDEIVALVEARALFLTRDLQFDTAAACRYQEAEAEYQRGRELEGSQVSRDSVAVIRQLADQRYGGGAELAYVWTNVADAGDADLAVAGLRKALEAAGRIGRGHDGAAQQADHAPTKNPAG